MTTAKFIGKTNLKKSFLSPVLPDKKFLNLLRRRRTSIELRDMELSAIGSHFTSESVPIDTTKFEPRGLVVFESSAMFCA